MRTIYPNNDVGCRVVHGLEVQRFDPAAKQVDEPMHAVDAQVLASGDVVQFDGRSVTDPAGPDRGQESVRCVVGRLAVGNQQVAVAGCPHMPVRHNREASDHHVGQAGFSCGLRDRS